MHGEGAFHGGGATPPILPHFSSTLITADELSMINKEPFQVVGKTFGFEGPGGELELFQIVGATEMLGRGRYYQVQMEGRVDYVEMSTPELHEWLENSIMVDCMQN